MGSNSSVLVQALITLSVALPAFFSGMFARRRSRADVEVTLSAEARNWAQSFADNARTAMDESREALARANRAESRARECQERMEAMEVHIERLEQIMRNNNLTPPRHQWDRI